MSGVYPVTQHGPDTYTVSATVTGGQLVMVDGSTGMVKPTTGVVSNILGVALTDGAPAGSGADNDFTTPPTTISVAYVPCTVKVKATGAIAFGDLVTSAAAGTVSTIASGTFAQDIGICVEPGGIADGALGRVRFTR
jgi:hypothetical protein